VADFSGYAPAFGSTGYAGTAYGGYGFDNYHEDWYKGFWNGLANLAGGVLAGGIGLAGAQPSQQTVVYANPYQEVSVAQTASVPQELDYSRPITPPTAKEASSYDEAVVNVGMRTFEEARAAMKNGRFAEAQELTEKAIALVPKDPALHEFRALCQFAQGQYKEAAGTLYAVLNAGAGFDWNTVAGLYPDVDTYTKQLHALEDAVRASPKEPRLHFLLGYHYMVLDERQAALEEFKEAARLNDKDGVSKRMVAALEQGAPKDATKPRE
jgi:tetratricopeptide (TPR) repeat protein